MKPDKAKAILRKAFGALTQEQQGNLRWHAEKGTKILCGKKAVLYEQRGAG
jgi:hypothetical protein